jgi:hypothetical protein
MDEIHDEEIKEWLDDCPTHKWEIKSCNENGIWLSVRFNNEKEEDDIPPPKENKPQAGKLYALTGSPGSKCIANGNTWEESVVGEEVKP